MGVCYVYAGPEFFQEYRLAFANRCLKIYVAFMKRR
jgi:hypothetical protein